MRLILVLLALSLCSNTAAQDRSDNDNLARAKALENCILDKAGKWASGPDPARDIAAAARHACEKLEIELADAAVASGNYDDPRKAALWDETSRQLTKAFADGLEAKAMRIVIEARSAS